MKKRVLTCLMIMALCFSLLPGGALAETNPDWTGYTAISTPAQLDAIRDNPSGKYYLTQDIVFETRDFEPGGAFYNGGKGWEPIRSFTGVLDGNGHAIVALYCVDRIQVGFIYINRGKIENIALVGAYLAGDTVAGIAVSNYGIVKNCANYYGVIEKADFSCAGIVASNSGTIEDCYNYSIVTSDTAIQAGGITASCDASGSISGCINEGLVASNNAESRVGGIIGYATVMRTFERCANLGTVLGAYAGGIAGESNTARISHCLNTGSYFGWYAMGGLVGLAEVSTIQYCYNAGDGLQGTSLAAGGLIGCSESSKLEFCYTVGRLPSQDTAGALAGTYRGTQGLQTFYCYAWGDGPLVGGGLPFAGVQTGIHTREELQRQETYVGFDFNEVWVMDDREGYTYPQLRQNICIGYSACDVNGDGKTTVSDVRLVLRAAVGKITLTEEQAWIADINGDGNITLADVRLSLRMAVGKESGTYYWALKE